jgi:threonine-phosphate decarboxylase
MCVCNPHSPSGTLYSKKTILDLVEFCNKKDIIFSIDENYIEFANESLDNTVAGMVKEYENLFVIRSVTKFYGMAGIRFGYAVAAGTLIDKLETVRQPWSINGLAGVVTSAAFSDTVASIGSTMATTRALSAEPSREVYAAARSGRSR